MIKIKIIYLWKFKHKTLLRAGDYLDWATLVHCWNYWCSDFYRSEMEENK